MLSPDRRHVWTGKAWVPANFSADGLSVWDGAAWRPAPPAPPPPPQPAQQPTSSLITFDFPVGQQEKHKVRLMLNQTSGQLTIDVDGEFIVNEVQQISLTTVKPYHFPVGKDELHTVIIEKRRDLFAVGARPYTFRVFIDDQLYGTYQGDGWLQT